MKLCSLMFCFMYLGYCLKVKHLQSRSLDHGEGPKSNTLLDHGHGPKSHTFAEVKKLMNTAFHTMNTMPVLVQGTKILDQNYTSTEPIQLKFFLENPSDARRSTSEVLKNEKFNNNALEKTSNAKENPSTTTTTTTTTTTYDNAPDDHVTSEVLKSEKFNNSLLSVQGKCERIEWDLQGCVTCFHSAKCKPGWSYHSHRHCGFWNWGCQSRCVQTYDWPCGACGEPCPTPAPTFPAPRPTPAPSPPLHNGPLFIINEKNGLVLTYDDGTLKLQFIDSGMDIKTGMLPNQHHQLFIVDSDGVWFGNTNVLNGFGYSRSSRTFTRGEDEKLCIHNHDLSNGSLTSSCSNCEGTTINWRLKTHEEAFPHDYNKMEEYYIASKESDLIVEKRGDIGSLPGFPLYMWIPQDLPGQLWHSDSYGRILSRNKWYVEAADVLTFCFKLMGQNGHIPLAGEDFRVSVLAEPNPDNPLCPFFIGPREDNNCFDQVYHVDFIVTHELARFGGKGVCMSMPGIPQTPGNHITTSAHAENGDHQQWVLHGGKLENGYKRDLLSLERNPNWIKEGIQMGMPTGLMPESTDKFYLVPRELTRSWLDFVQTKRDSYAPGGIVKNAILKELLFYQKTAAFHMSTVIGMSPEELVTRSYVLKKAAIEAASQLEKSGKNYHISEIVRNSVDLVATGFNILGYALAGPTMGLSFFFTAIGNLLSLSNNAATKINGFYSEHVEDKKDAQEVLDEIQKSVLSGGFALSSFIDDYVEVIQRYDAYRNSTGGQKELAKMREDADILAKEMAYDNWDAFQDDLMLHGMNIYLLSAEAYKHMTYNYGAIPLLEYAMFNNFDKHVAYRKFTGIDLGASNQYFTQGVWILSALKGLGGIILNSHRLSKGALDSPIGDAIVNNVEFLERAIPDMYSKISDLAGDADDLMVLEALVDELGEKIDIADSNEWRTLDDKGNGDMENQVYGSLYNVLWDW